MDGIIPTAKSGDENDDTHFDEINFDEVDFTAIDAALEERQKQRQEILQRDLKPLCNPMSEVPTPRRAESQPSHNSASSRVSHDEPNVVENDTLNNNPEDEDGPLNW